MMFGIMEGLTKGVVLLTSLGGRLLNVCIYISTIYIELYIKYSLFVAGAGEFLGLLSQDDQANQFQLGR